jgi:hypothetical protein
MRIINYLFERGAITARRRVTISEMERDLGINRGNIYRLIVGGKGHRSYLRGFVHYPDKGLREGFYLLPAGILAAIGASKEEIAEVLTLRKESQINNPRWIIQFYHRLNSYKLPPKVKEILRRDNLNYDIAISRLTCLLANKTAIKVLKALLQLGATSWKSAVTITETSKAAGLNKGTVYKLTTQTYRRAKKSRTKSRPPVLHGVVHYSKPNTKEGKYYIYPKWVPFAEWLVNATEKDIERLLNSEDDLKKLASLFLTPQNSGFPQVADKMSAPPQIANQVSSKLPIPFSFDSFNSLKENNLPASSGRRAATEAGDHPYNSKETIDKTPQQPPQPDELSHYATLSKHATLSTDDQNIRFSGVGEGRTVEPPQRDKFSQPEPPPLIRFYGGSGSGSGGGGSVSGGRRLRYHYVKSDGGEIVCKIPYRPKPSREELAGVWREWFVPNVRARILSFAKLYGEGRCSRCLSLVGQEKLKHFHISWERRLWRVVKRYGLDSAALQLLAFNKTYVCSDCFSMLLLIAHWVAMELRHILRKHVGYDVFEPVCMRCGSPCVDCTHRKVHWARYWNEEIALKKVLAFLADFEVYLSKFEPPRSSEEAKAQLRKLEALFRKQYDPDYWSWAEWHDYPLEEVDEEGEWNRNYEYTPPPERIDLPEPDDEDEIQFI